jgi:adenine-specific DNA-methyltransferase
VRQAARDARKEPTKSETVLWQALRNRGLGGRKFRRQQPVGPFILDFYCHDESLAIEVDGGIHAGQSATDAQRQAAIESVGVRFVRITADLVENDLQAALAKIEAAFTHPPLSRTGEGPGERV